MKSWSHNFACKILRNRQGSVAIHVALTASVIIGMAGLGAEITYLLYKHRQLQVVADAAALSAGAVLANSKSSPTTEARAIAAHLGFVNGANGVTITVNNPPQLSTHYAGDEKAIEVVVKQPQSLSAVKMFHSGLFDVKARATALVQGKPICLLALQTYGIGMYITGGGHNEIEGCGVAVNSSANEALYITGGAALKPIPSPSSETISSTLAQRWRRNPRRAPPPPRTPMRTWLSPSLAGATTHGSFSATG